MVTRRKKTLEYYIYKKKSFYKKKYLQDINKKKEVEEAFYDKRYSIEI